LKKKRKSFQQSGTTTNNGGLKPPKALRRALKPIGNLKEEFTKGEYSENIRRRMSLSSS